MYRVWIEETLCKIINVEAESEYEAFKKVYNDYKNEKIILEDSNYVSTSAGVIDSDDNWIKYTG